MFVCGCLLLGVRCCCWFAFVVFGFVVWVFVVVVVCGVFDGVVCLLLFVAWCLFLLWLRCRGLFVCVSLLFVVVCWLLLLFVCV